MNVIARNTTASGCIVLFGRRAIVLAAVMVMALSLPGRIARAGNVLVNPGFEADPAGQTQSIVAWTRFGMSSDNTFGETGARIAHSGANYFKVFQGFSGTSNYDGIYQRVISGPGATYSADGWAYTSSSDTLAGKNVAWLEVTFRDAAGNILSLYRSSLITTNLIGSGAFSPGRWIDLPLTNQYDPLTLRITNRTDTLTAPPGASYAQYQVQLQGDTNPAGGSISGGSIYFDDLALNQTSGGRYGNWNVTWSDEFNGASINSSVWTFDIGNNNGWGNNELEYYTSSPQNAYVSNGLLHIVALQQSVGGYHYTSARMKTQRLYSKTYGRFEFRARLPAGVGFWPALWMLGTDITSAGWPGCGEIDVMENKGGFLTNVQGSLHSGSDETGIYTLPEGSVTDFHNYLLEWTNTAVNWFADGVLYETQTNWTSSQGAYPAPFNQPFFLIMNVAVGGNYLGNPSQGGINSNSVFPGEMQVDYVRIYDITAPLEISAAAGQTGLFLAWPANVVCHLESTSNLPGVWTPVNNASNPYSPPATLTSSMFYRLQSP